LLTSSQTLQEDGLNLWLSALRNTTTIASVDGAPALSDLIPSALGLLADDKDILGTIINIVESYIFLDALGVVQVGSVSIDSLVLRSFADVWCISF